MKQHEILYQFFQTPKDSTVKFCVNVQSDHKLNILGVHYITPRPAKGAYSMLLFLHTPRGGLSALKVGHVEEVPQPNGIDQIANKCVFNCHRQKSFVP